MAEHVFRLPFGLNPLIAEAKRRMRRRRFLLAAILVAAAGLTVALAFAVRPGGPEGPQAGGASTTTYRTNWTVAVRVHGRLAMRATVYWIKVAQAGWAVKASVVNLSGHTLRPSAGRDSGWGLDAVTTGERAHPVQCTGHRCFGSRASSFLPALPRSLPPGARWTGVVRGTGPIPHDSWVSPDLGYYLGWPRGGFGYGPTRRAVHIR